MNFKNYLVNMAKLLNQRFLSMKKLVLVVVLLLLILKNMKMHKPQ